MNEQRFLSNNSLFTSMTQARNTNPYWLWKQTKFLFYFTSLFNDAVRYLPCNK